MRELNKFPFLVTNFLSFKQYNNSLCVFAEHICLNLCFIPLCHTLSKTIEISIVNASYPNFKLNLEIYTTMCVN